MFEMLYQNFMSVLVSVIVWIVGLFFPLTPVQSTEPDYPTPQFQDEVVVIGDQFNNGILADNQGGTEAKINDPASGIISSFKE